MIRGEDEHYIMIKGSIHQQDVTIVNIITPNIQALKCIRQILTDIKGEIDNKTLIVEDFSSPLSAIDKWSQEKIKKELVGLNHTLEKMDVTDIHRAFCPRAEYTPFPSAPGTASRMRLCDNTQNK